MKYEEVEKDLFTVSEDYALAHCIAKDAIMGAGIALEFTKRFPNMKDAVKSVINDNSLPIKSVVNHVDDETDRLIINLITKEKSSGKPTRKDFDDTITTLKEHVEKYNIKKIAIPQIGSGLDRLKWNVSSKFIQKTFKDTDVEILVCVYGGGKE